MILERRSLLGTLLAGGGLALAPRLAAAIDQAEKLASPWRPLFNGHNLDGWSIFEQGEGRTDSHGAIKIERSELHMLGASFKGPDKAAYGHIATLDDHANYHFRMEFRFGPRRFSPRTLQRRNSGLLYHMAPDRDRLFPDCVEFQYEEGDVGDAIMVNTKALLGPQLGGTPLWPNYIPGLPTDYVEPLTVGGIARQWHRHAGHYEKLDDWNQVDLYAFDDQAAHLVNGRIVTTLFRMIDRAGQPLKKGRIALEFEGAEVFMRNIKIRELSQTEIGSIKSGR